VIVDSSALLAILLQEGETSALEACLGGADRVRMSAATLLETAIVVDGRGGPVLGARLDRMVQEARIGVEPVTWRQAEIARQAYRDYGRGSGHPARLNFGDCFAYALARETGEELLFVGDDFAHTDVWPALRPEPPPQ
jgi:ribonuclease VapC